MSKYKPLDGETANGSINQLWFLRSFIASGDRIALGEKRKVQEAAKSSAQHIVEHRDRIKAGGE